MNKGDLVSFFTYKDGKRDSFHEELFEIIDFYENYIKVKSLIDDEIIFTNEESVYFRFQKESRDYKQYEWYKKCIDKNNYLFKQIKEKFIKYKFKMEYSTSYYTYFNKTTLNQNSIKLIYKNFSNTSIDFHSMLCEVEEPYILSFWKYVNGNHYFKSIKFKNIDKLNLDFIFEEIIKFFNLEKERYEQLTLF